MPSSQKYDIVLLLRATHIYMQILTFKMLILNCPSVSFLCFLLHSADSGRQEYLYLDNALLACHDYMLTTSGFTFRLLYRAFTTIANAVGPCNSIVSWARSIGFMLTKNVNLGFYIEISLLQMQWAPTHFMLVGQVYIGFMLIKNGNPEVLFLLFTKCTMKCLQVF